MDCVVSLQCSLILDGRVVFTDHLLRVFVSGLEVSRWGGCVGAYGVVCGVSGGVSGHIQGYMGVSGGNYGVSGSLLSGVQESIYTKVSLCPQSFQFLLGGDEEAASVFSASLSQFSVSLLTR